MKILAIESSAKAASVCITDDGRLIAEAYQNNGLTHSTTIMPMAAHMLDTCGMDLEQIDKIAVAAGPGSFTGLRIGVAAAKGLSWACDIPVCGVSTLAAMAHQASFWDGLICPVMDARAGQVYHAIFRSTEGRIERICEDRAVSLDTLVERLKHEKSIFLLGDGAHLCYNELAERADRVRLAPFGLRYPRAWGVAAAAQDVLAAGPEALTIQYLRLPQAERERLSKIKDRMGERKI